MTTSKSSTLLGPQSSTMAVFILEAGGWLMVFAMMSTLFGISGIAGAGTVVPASDFGLISEASANATFDLATATLFLLVGLVLAGGGLFLPRTVWKDRAGPAMTPIVAGAAVASAVVGILVFIWPVVWLCWIVAALLGVMVSALARYSPATNRKPWRSAGIAALITLVVDYAFQIVRGQSAGVDAMHWLLLVGAIGLVLAGVVVFLSSPPAEPDHVTGAFPQTRATRLTRGPVAVSRPWVCYVLFADLGAIIVLAQPSVVDLHFGEAGCAVILCATLLGWAAGFEIGPTFAPGMTRPRVTSFALLVAGVGTIAAGVLTELSGTAVVSGLVAFAVGIGVRAQDYTFSRRYGLAVGAFLALLLTSLEMRTTVVVSEATSWEITATTMAYIIIGLFVLIAGVVALFVFCPQGIRGIGIEIVHAFREPNHTAAEAGAPSAASAVPHSAGTSVPGEEEPVGASDSAASDPAASSGETEGGLVLPNPRTSPSGLFIALEGGDGTGKTTQMEFLRRHLEERERSSVVATREPGGTPEGARIREIIMGGEPVNEKSEALLYAADRAHHVDRLIDPALAAGSTVLTDRYIDSSLAYQAAGRELGESDIASLSRWAADGLVPHLTIVLDMDPEVSAARTADRGAEDHLERLDLSFRTRVRETFLALAAAHPHRYVVVDANRAPSEVATDIATAVDEFLDRDRAAHERTVAIGGDPRHQDDSSDHGGSSDSTDDSRSPSADSSDEAATTVLPVTGSGVAVTDVSADLRESDDAKPNDARTEDETHGDAERAGTTNDGTTNDGTTRDAAAGDDRDEGRTASAGSRTSAGSGTSGDLPTTEAMPRVDPDATGAMPSVDPDATGAMPRVDPDSTEAMPVVDPDSTAAMPLVEEDGETTLMRMRPQSSSRDRLRAQSEIERAARDRLRESRNRGGRDEGEKR